MVRGEPSSNKEMVGLALAVKLAEVFHRKGQESMRETGVVVIDVDFKRIDQVDVPVNMDNAKWKHEQRQLPDAPVSEDTGTSPDKFFAPKEG